MIEKRGKENLLILIFVNRFTVMRKTQRLATIQAKLDLKIGSQKQLEVEIPHLLAKKVFYSKKNKEKKE